MTQNDETKSSESENSDTNALRKGIQKGFHPIRYRLHKFFHKTFSRKPAYMVKKNGIEVRYFDFNDTDTLPFDPETYSETQLFIGSWANPWYVDIDEIKEQYDDFTEETVTKVDDVFSKKHIYPSQRWKMLANQNVLSEMFIGRSLRQQRVIRLLYAVLGGIVVLGLITVFGG